MVAVAAIPGTTSANDSFPTIARIKHSAKQSVSSYRGATAINLLNTARKAVETGILKEDAGDLQDALLKYYQAANILSYVMSTQEYKAEDAPGKHGAVYQQTVQFLKYFQQTTTPRMQAVETRLQEVESSSRAPAVTAAAAAPNGKLPSRRQTEDDGPNETSGGSLAERMKKLRGAGMDMTTVGKPTTTGTGAAAVGSKRLSHQSNPSTSSSIQSPMTPQSQNGSASHHRYSDSSASVVGPTLPNGAAASAALRNAVADQSVSSQYARGYQQPSVGPVSSPPATSSPSFSATSFSGLNHPASPSSSPRVTATEIRRQGTGSSGVTSSPRHRNLQSLSTTESAPRRLSDVILPTGTSNDLPPVTPSVSTFTSEYPSVEDFDKKYDFSSPDGLPAVPESQLPMFPSVPTSQVGSSAGKPTASSSDGRAPPDLPLSTRPSTRPPSASSVPLRLQHSGSSGHGSRSDDHSSRATPSLNTTPTPARSSSKRPDIPLTNGIYPEKLRTFLDAETNGGIQVLLLDVRSMERHEQERIDAAGSVWIDPIVLNRKDVTVNGIEAALAVSPAEEELMFRNRNMFDMVVMYDDSSTIFIPTLGALNRLIYQPEAVKTLRRQPMLLLGGVKRWKKDLGTVGLVGSAVGSDTPKVNGTHDVQQSVVNGAASSSRNPPAPNGAVAAEPRSRTGADIYAEERDRRRNAHVRDGAVFEASPTPNEERKPENQDSGAPEAREPLIRRSTLVRPSSSGTISAYNRPVVDTTNGGIYANHAPINYPSRVGSTPTGQASTPPVSFSTSSAYLSDFSKPPAVAQPPQASLGNSPLARRRSDYVEQSLFSYSGLSPGSTRASIDYPALSVQHVVRPPPPVASNAMERQEQRPRGHTASISVATTPTNGMTVIGKFSILTPPMITLNYSVVYWSDTRIGTVGLRNMGNTCYMNSVVQCLSATVPFSRFFTDGRWKSAVNMQNPLGGKGQVALAFANMVYELWQAQGQGIPYLTPNDFRNNVCKYAPQFKGTDQHDAQEFLSFLLDGLHEDLNRVLRKPVIPSPTAEREKELEILPQQIAAAQEWQLYRLRDDSIVVDYFQGQFRNRLTCLTCNFTSTTYNTFMPLSLPIPTGRNMSKVTLDACLQAFVAPEILEKGDAWKCSNCKTLRKASKQLSLSRLPPVLLIHLKRFSFKGPFTDKLETMVDFPIKDLDLTNYMPPLLHPNDDKTGMYSQKAYSHEDPRLQVPAYKYELYAVTNHYGSLSSGHYTSYIASNGGWQYYDDSRVAAADARDVVGRPAYILYYRRVRTI